MKHYHKLLLLFLCNNSLLFLCYAMKEPFRTFPVEYEKLSGSKITGIEQCAQIVKITLKDRETPENFFLYFLNLKLGTKNYLAPIFDDPELKKDFSYDSQELSKKSADYFLLSICYLGSTNYLSLAFERGANSNAIDYRTYNVLFSIQNNGKESTLLELFLNKIIPDNLQLILANKFFAGVSTHGISALEYALKAQSLELVQKLLDHGATTTDNFKKIIDKLKNYLDTKNETIVAQKNCIIPSFKIEKKINEHEFQDLENIQIRKFHSQYDKTIYIRCIFNKDFIRIEPDENHTYTEELLDVDTLANIYACLLVWNKNGLAISNFYYQWKQYILFKYLIIHYLVCELNRKAYEYDPTILPENLLLLVKNILCSQDKLSCFEIYLIKYLFKYFFVLAAYQQEWKASYTSFEKFLSAQEAGRKILKEFYQEEKILTKPIKNILQNYSLHEYLATVLARGIPSLPLDITRKIVEFWEPCEIFIEAIRNIPKLKDK